MAYFLIENGTVIQKQPNEEDGFIEGPEDVICGFLYDGQHFTAPSAPEPHPTNYNISKADIYRRCTNAEAEALHTALLSAPIRLQGIFSGATMINTGDDYFPDLRAGIVASLGETRADEVLAPSF